MESKKYILMLDDELSLIMNTWLNLKEFFHDKYIIKKSSSIFDALNIVKQDSENLIGAIIDSKMPLCNNSRTSIDKILKTDDDLYRIHLLFNEKSNEKEMLFNGFFLSIALKQLYPQCKICILSAYVNLSDLEEDKLKYLRIKIKEKNIKLLQKPASTEQIGNFFK